VQFLAHATAYMLSALYAIAHPSHGWISRKQLKFGLWTFHHTVAPCL